MAGGGKDRHEEALSHYLTVPIRPINGCDSRQSSERPNIIQGGFVQLPQNPTDLLVGFIICSLGRFLHDKIEIGRPLVRTDQAETRRARS